MARVLPERDGPRSRPRLLHAHAHRCDGNPRGARRRARRAVGARPAPRRADRPGQHARIRRRRDRGADRGADQHAHRAAGRARGLDHAHRARPPRRHRDRRSGVLGRGERVAGVRVGLDGPPAGWTAVARGSGTAGARPRARGAHCRGARDPRRCRPAGRRGHHRDRAAARIVEDHRRAARTDRGVASRPRDHAQPARAGRAGAPRCARPHTAAHPRRTPRGREHTRRVDQRRAHDPARRHHPARHAPARRRRLELRPDAARLRHHHPVGEPRVHRAGPADRCDRHQRGRRRRAVRTRSWRLRDRRRHLAARRMGSALVDQPRRDR